MKRFFTFLSRRPFIVIYFLFAVAAFLRVYQFGWGAPFFFHPDERNIAMAVTRLSPERMNPEFFAYGSLPLYVIYGIGVVENIVWSFFGDVPNLFVVGFDHAILISRLLSAVLSIGVLYLVFRLRHELGAYSFWIAFVLSIFSVGYIQYAHFGTFEMWLTFFGFLLFYFLYLYSYSKKLYFFILSCVVFGVLLSVKVSSAVVFPALTAPIVYLYWKRGVFHLLRKLVLLSLVAVCISAGIFLLTNPFFLLDNSSYISSLSYESSVATGTLPVFYTGRFFETIPVFFTFLRTYPFLINPLNTILFPLSLGIFVYALYKKRDFFHILALLFFLLLFIPQAFLFVKWNRYMIPTLPFVYLILAFGIDQFVILMRKKRVRILRASLLFLITTIAIIFSMSFFGTVYIQEDTRVKASRWAAENIRPSAPILSEVYDLGVVPFERNFSAITLVNTYEFGNGEVLPKLSSYEYILLPSPRILRSRLALPERYPEGHSFYSSLIDGTAGYTLIYESPCDILCQIAYLGDPVYQLEETANVFDRPSVFIYENENR